MTDTYKLLIYYVHSELELIKNNLEVDENTTVENFQHRQVNKNICTQIFKATLDFFNYELSHNQMCNGINRFLNSQKIKLNEGMKPSEFAKIKPFSSVLQKSEAETVASNIMKILERTGDVFRKLPWEEYEEERLKDDDFLNVEKMYFIDAAKYTESADQAKLFSKAWDLQPETVEG